MNLVKGIIEFVMDILETIAFVGSLFIVIYLFIFQPNQVKGVSMEPTFQSGDYIITSKITYKFKKIERGDVIVFNSPKNPDIEYIKRVIGLPGDKIEVRNNEVYVNDQILPETYISAKTNLWDNGYLKENIPIYVPENYVFVMGDNRPRSSDSREFGPIPISSIVGTVIYRYFPPQKMGVIKNPLPSHLKSFFLTHKKIFSKIYSPLSNYL